jgi:hypothetical protein
MHIAAISRGPAGTCGTYGVPGNITYASLSIHEDEVGSCGGYITGEDAADVTIARTRSNTSSRGVRSIFHGNPERWLVHASMQARQNEIIHLVRRKGR